MERARLKELFADGQRPTGADFAAALDSFVHKDDKVKMTDVNGLVQKLEEISEMLTGRAEVIHISQMGDTGGLAVNPGEYFYIPEQGLLAYYSGSESAVPVTIRHDVLYINDDGEHGCSKGFYALNEDGKLSRIV